MKDRAYAKINLALDVFNIDNFTALRSRACRLLVIFIL